MSKLLQHLIQCLSAVFVALLALSVNNLAAAAPVFRQLHSFTEYSGLPNQNGLVVGKGNELYGYLNASSDNMADYHVFQSRLGGATTTLATLSGEYISDMIVATGGSLLVVQPDNLHSPIISKVALDGTVTPFVYTPTSVDPITILLGSDGNYYGVAKGGTNGDGAIYQITAQAPHKLTILHQFGTGNDGTYPDSLIQTADGSFYGTTSLNSGGDPLGTIFKLTSSGIYSVIYRFRNNENSFPYLSLQGSDGTIYGYTTSSRNSPGSVFAISQSDQYSLIYTFTGGADGYDPETIVQQASTGNLYGITDGGGQYNGGTFYQLNPSSQSITTLLSFDEPRSSTPYIIVADPNGQIYGLSEMGGTDNDGTLFSITPSP